MTDTFWQRLNTLGLLALLLAIGTSLVVAAPQSGLRDLGTLPQMTGTSQWSQGAAGYRQAYARARADNRALIVYIHSPHCPSTPCADSRSSIPVNALNSQGFRRLQSQAWTVSIDPNDGPSAQYVANRFLTNDRLRRNGGVFVELPGDGIAPMNAHRLSPAAVNRTLIRAYEQAARSHRKAGRWQPAERAQQQARSWRRLL